MLNALAARWRAASTSPVTQTGRPAITRGAGRPASAAALVIDGTMWLDSVDGPVIHVSVPPATEPASCSMRGASAAISTGGALVPGTLIWALAFHPVASTEAC